MNKTKEELITSKIEDALVSKYSPNIIGKKALYILSIISEFTGKLMNYESALVTIKGITAVKDFKFKFSFNITYQNQINDTFTYTGENILKDFSEGKVIECKNKNKGFIFEDSLQIIK